MKPPRLDDIIFYCGHAFPKGAPTHAQTLAWAVRHLASIVAEQDRRIAELESRGTVLDALEAERAAKGPSR